jgi:maleate cis-trans isomerase
MASIHRLGIMVPSVNVVLEDDLPKQLMPGVMAHYTRVKLSANTESEIAGMADYVPQAAADLADANVDVIGFACTGGSVIGGLGYDQRIANGITAKTSIPATTTATAIVAGLRELGATSIALGTPYEAWLNEKEVRFFEANGFRVVSEQGLGVPDPGKCQAVDQGRIRRLARDIDRKDADAIVLSCANFRAWDIVGEIERELGKPVITSNNAIVWHMLKLIGQVSMVRQPSALWAGSGAAAVA